MGVAGNALDLIRLVANRRNALTIGPSYFDSISASAISYSNVTLGPQNGYNDYLTDSVKLDQDLMSRFADYEDMDDFPELGAALDIYCLHGDTEIPLLNGTVMRIKDLADLPAVDDLWVYSCDGSKLVPAKIKSAQKTGHAKRLIKVVFDDGGYIKCTPEHKFMARDGRFVEAQNLTVETSLMPFYKRYDARGYEEVYDGNDYLTTHRWAFNHRHEPRIKRNVVHHVDFDKRNNNPENLRQMNWHDHRALHSAAWEKTIGRPEIRLKSKKSGTANLIRYNRTRFQDPEVLRRTCEALGSAVREKWRVDNNYRKKMRPVQIENGKRLSDAGLNRHFGEKNHTFRPDVSYDQLLSEIENAPYVSKKTLGRLMKCGYRVLDRLVKTNGFQDWSDFKVKVVGVGARSSYPAPSKPLSKNHKVASLEYLNEAADVFDLTIEGPHHCFAAGSDGSYVIVHNSDDATVQDVVTKKRMWFESDNHDIEKILNGMLDINLKVEDDLWSIARNLCKYGNGYEELYVLDKVGVIKLNHLASPAMRRIEDVNGIVYGFIFDPTMTFRMDTLTFLDKLREKGVTKLTPVASADPYYVQSFMQVFEPWEVVHFRLRGKTRRDIYGYAATEAARYAWKRLTMLEDAMVLYKLTRSPQRYAYYVDVGDVPPQQAKSFLNKIKNEFKKTKFVDPSSGKVSFRFNPLSMDEDLFLPVRKGKRGTEVEVLAGPEGQQVDDVNYFLNKIFAALKIPKSYLGADETVGRANLSQLDVRHARSVLRIQREIKNGFEQIARVDLSARNIDPDRVSFACNMVVPSGVFELAQLEVEQAKLDLGQRYKDANFSEYYIWSKVLGMADDEILNIQNQRTRETQDAGDFTPDQATEMKRIMPRAVDQAQNKMDPNLRRHTQQIIDEVGKGQTKFARQIIDLKHVAQDLAHSVRQQKHFNGRRSE